VKSLSSCLYRYSPILSIISAVSLKAYSRDVQLIWLGGYFEKAALSGEPYFPMEIEVLVKLQSWRKFRIQTYFLNSSAGH